MTLITLGVAWITGLLAGIYLDAAPVSVGAFLVGVGGLALLLHRISVHPWVAIVAMVFLFGLMRVELVRTLFYLTLGRTGFGLLARSGGG